jgi:hypothetical protein
MRKSKKSKIRSCNPNPLRGLVTNLDYRKKYQKFVTMAVPHTTVLSSAFQETKTSPEKSIGLAIEEKPNPSGIKPVTVSTTIGGSSNNRSQPQKESSARMGKLNNRPIRNSKLWLRCNKLFSLKLYTTGPKIPIV